MAGGNTLRAQNVEELIRRAYVKYDDKDYQGAAAEIDAVTDMKKGAGNPLAWHIKGFIYKDMFVHEDGQNPKSKAREVAVDALFKSMELDSDDDFKANNINALKFLASIYFNDARDVIEARNKQDMPLADHYYAQYRTITERIGSDENLDEKDIMYYLAMATACRKIYETDREDNAEYYEKSNAFYKKVLDVDPDNFPALYSLGVSYYNKGASNLEKLPELDIQDVIRTQGESMQAIQVALPFMLKAYEVNPERIEAIKGLKYIHFNLHDHEKHEFFNEKLEMMEKEESGKD